MDRCTGRRDVTEILLKTALTIKSIFLLAIEKWSHLFPVSLKTLVKIEAYLLESRTGTKELNAANRLMDIIADL